ncbi:MAG: nicotinate (nicotinamide) nucleotide adenylyltransferase [Flavobacteriaceae bacterium]|nr:nicotinate (nicotinamide) nucleotide adenylyltransferase [Flavobacteriaceae bacterium]
MNIGLYFGTFNPIHIGHLIIANHLVEYSDLEEVWLVVSPHNPFKDKKSLLDNHHRLAMVQLAIEDFPKLKVSDIEFKLPQPSYTIKTLAYLTEKYPNHHFSLIMGEDNLRGFHKWKNQEQILQNHFIYVYPRIKTKEEKEKSFLNHPNIKFMEAPIIQISATSIRKSIKNKKNVLPLLPIKVWNYIDEMNFYKK